MHRIGHSSAPSFQGSSSDSSASVERLADLPISVFTPPPLEGDLLFPTRSGGYEPDKFSIADGLYLLERKLPGQEGGLLTATLKNERDQTKVINPLVTLAMGNCRASSRYSHNAVPRNEAEISILAQASTNLFCDGSTLVIRNREAGYIPNTHIYPTVRKFAKNAVNAYIEKCIIPSSGRGATVLDVGAAFGATTKYLKRKNFNVTALEPYPEHILSDFTEYQNAKPNIKHDAITAIQELVPTTVEDFAQSHPNTSFDIVHASNLYPGEESTTSSIFAAMAKLTKPRTGKAIIGINNRDTHFLYDSEKAILPQLEENFDDVRFHSAQNFSEYRQHYSVGGMLGFYECKSPK